MKKRKARKIPYCDLMGGSAIVVGLSPYETVAKALAALKPGETVYLRAGTYTEKIAPKD